MGTSFWIIPPSSITEELRKIATIRKDKPHSAASYPSCEPHITLASIPRDLNIPLSSLRDCIPTNQRTFQVKFDSVNVGDHYFRSVYITIRLSTQLDSELIDLHRKVHEKLGVQPQTPKFPHLSLVYVSDEDAKHGEREAYFKELDKRGLVLHKSLEAGEEGSDGGVELRAGLEREWMGGFQAAEVWIVKCEGAVEDWEVLDKIILA